MRGRGKEAALGASTVLTTRTDCLDAVGGKRSCSLVQGLRRVAFDLALQLCSFESKVAVVRSGTSEDDRCDAAALQALNFSGVTRVPRRKSEELQECCSSGKK